MKRLLLALLLLAGCLSAALASPNDTLFPAKPNPPRLVVDFAQVLGAGKVSELETKLRELNRSTSTQISIVTVNSLHGYAVAAYGTELFERWGIGQEKKDNGVLILFSPGDREVTITVGRGLEGALTDQEAGRIIRQIIAPAFKQGKYYEGLDKASDAVIEAVKGEYKADGEQKGIGGGGVFTLIIVVIIVLVIISRIGGGGRGGGGSYMSGRGNRGFGDGFLSGAILGGLLGGRGGWGGGGGFGGGGGWGGGGDSGGGFGGFGGGSTAGGGASGSW